MKGFLKYGQSVFQLTSKITTIGRESCDLTIQSPLVDIQHALINYNNDDEEYYIQDLDSKFGTYLNGKKLLKSAELIVDGDVIRFGNIAVDFVFATDNPPMAKSKSNQDLVRIQTRLPHLSQSSISSKTTRPHQVNTTPFQALNDDDIVSNQNTKCQNKCLTVRQSILKNHMRPPSEPISNVVLFKRNLRSANNVREKHKNLFMRKNSCSELNLQSKQQDRPHQSINFLHTMKPEELSVMFDDDNNNNNNSNKEISPTTINIINNDDNMDINANNNNNNNFIQKNGRNNKTNYNNKIQNNQNDEQIIEDLLNKLKKLESLLKDKQDEVNFFKNEVGRLRALEVNHLTYRVDDNREIIHLKQELESLNRQLATYRDENKTLNDGIEKQRDQAKENENLVSSLEKDLSFLDKKNVELLREYDSLKERNDGLNCKVIELKSHLEESQKTIDLQVVEVDGLRSELNNLIDKERNMVATLQEHSIKSGPTDLGNHDDNWNDLESIVGDLCKQIESLRHEKGIQGKEIESFLETCNKIMNDVTTQGPTAAQLKKSKSKFEAEKKFIEENFGSIISSNSLVILNGLFDYCIQWQGDVERSLLNGRTDVELHSKIDLISYIEGLHGDIANISSELTSAYSTIERMKIERETDVQSYKVQMEALRSEKEVEICKHVDEMNILKLNSDERIQILQQEIQSLKEAHNVSEGMNERAMQDLRENHEVVQNNLKQQIQTLNNQINRLNEEHSESIDNHLIEMKEHKEQIRQHSLTICSMEDRQKILEDDMKCLSTEKAILENFLEGLKTKQASDVQNTLEENAKFQIQLQKMKKENSKHLKTIDDLEMMISDLKSKLNRVHVKLTDSSGILTEEQKQLMEDQSKMIEDQKDQLRSAELEIERYKSIERDLTEKVENMTDKISKYEEALNSNEKVLKKFEKKMDVVENINSNINMQHQQQQQQQQQLLLLDRSLSPTKSGLLNSQGLLCIREKHDLIIKRQQTALVQLRSKVKALECGDNPLLSRDEALQQVAYLRRELEELKSVHLAKVKVNGAFDGSYVVNTDEMDASSLFAMKDLMELIEISENMYQDLQRCINTTLNPDPIIGMRNPASVLQIPRERLDDLIGERKMICNQFVNQINGLKEVIRSKNDLLDGYDQDLARLRMAEKYNEKLNENLDIISTDLLKKKDEIQCLRESLVLSKEKLERSRHDRATKFKLKRNQSEQRNLNCLNA